MSQASTPLLNDLLEQHRSGFALEQGFYTSSEVFERDVEAILMQEWHFAGLATEIAEPGDYMVFELLKESVIIVRGDDGEVRTFANVCRHRGSRVCLEHKGKTSRFVCPYHAWTYGLDGKLLNARMMGSQVEREDFGLKSIPCEIFHGMIFVTFAENPSSFDQMRAELDAPLSNFGLENTKVARRVSYPVKANWKLLVENYNECYHCGPAHPEFKRTHPTHMTADKVEPFNEAMIARAEDVGASTAFVDRVGPLCPQGSVDYTYSRHSLYEAYDTGSENGQAVAPLLGTLKGYDQGASDLYVGMLNPLLIYNDYAVIYRFIPIDQETSVQEIIWLVHEDAEEGRDYELDRLCWLWDVTTVADKLIIEKNQEGVNSRFYEPGPLADMEFYTQRFLDYYVARLRA
ncbi:MAG: aromatic ring-hydroxylating oxygenase subunit alpha [Alphaproteobacteria bacterium]